MSELKHDDPRHEIRVARLEKAMLKLSREIAMEPEEFIIFASTGRAAVLAHREALATVHYEPRELPIDDPDELLRQIAAGWNPDGDPSHDQACLSQSESGDPT